MIDTRDSINPDSVRIDVVGGRRRPTPLPIAIAATESSVQKVDEVARVEFREEVAAHQGGAAVTPCRPRSSGQ